MFTPILAIVVTSVSPLPQSDTFQLPASLVSSAALLRNAGNDASRFNGEMEWYRSRSGAATVLEAVNQSVKTNLSGFNYGEEPGIYIYSKDTLEPRNSSSNDRIVKNMEARLKETKFVYPIDPKNRIEEG